MLRIAYVVIALFALTLPSFAQKKVKAKVIGMVKTSDGKPAENITVRFANTSYGDITDISGHFQFEAPAGEYTMEVYSISAHKKIAAVTIKSDVVNKFYDLSILENKNQLTEVVVTGQFAPQSIQNSIYKVKVITAKQIQEKAATSLPNLLNTELGIRLSNDMALGETDFELMGMSGNNVKVLLDGVPLIDRLSNKQSLSQIDINIIDRIEIIEGPMSVVYGTDALAGVINVITKRSVPNGIGSHLSLKVRLQEESVGDEYHFLEKEGAHNQGVSGRYTLGNGLYIGGSFTNNRFDGWQGDSTGRKKEWQSKTQYISGGQIGITKANYSLSYRMDYLNENLLTEADINAVTYTTSDKEFIVNRYTHQFLGDWKTTTKLHFSLAGSYQDYSRRTRTSNIDLSTGKKTLSMNTGEQDKTTFDSWFGRVMAVWDALPNLKIQPGVEVKSDKGAGDRLPGTHNITDGAFFLSAEYKPFEWLALRPGFRSSINSVYDAPLAVPAINIKASLSKNVDWRISYARGFRAPTLQELYYSFHDSNHNIDGNPDLKAEYSNSYQTTFTWRSIHEESLRVTSHLTGFYNDFRNRISLVESSVNTGYNIYENIDRYKTIGTTLENILYWQTLKSSLNFSYIGRYNKYSADATYADQNPTEFRYSTEIAASISYEWKKVATLSAFYKFTGKRKEYYVDSDDKLVLLGMSSYNWADITISRPVGQHLVASAGVKNIFGITTVTNTSTSESAHSSGNGTSQMGCGRSYFVGLSFNLDK
jgi:outer membrane receptor for ferrienterochelin and colicins